MRRNRDVAVLVTDCIHGGGGAPPFFSPLSGLSPPGGAGGGGGGAIVGTNVPLGTCVTTRRTV
jgi:hypothetical protein